FMLLVMTPAMYCNTSDSWILPNKWHRIAIGAAGMYVEVVLASFCTFVWWYTQPGTVHYIALNAMFLCGVSTLIFNANPLLRYDGYYMLSDYLEIPNMGSKSRMALLSKLRVWCLGMKPISPRLLPTRRQFSFAIYAVASFVYRWFVMLMIFWFLTKMFEPYGLEILGHALIVISLVGMIGIPFYKLVKFFIYPGRFREVKFFRFAISLVLFTIAVGGLFAIPMTHNVAAPFVVQPTEMQKVFVTTPGRLVKVNFSPGDKVKENDIVAELENDELVFELEQIKNQIKSENAKLDAYEIQIQQDIDVSGERESAQTAIENLTKKLAFQQEKIKKLQLVANRSGIIIPPPNVVPQKMDIHDTRSLQKWSGTPLDPENRQAYLETQTLYCKIGDSKKMKAMLMIDQSSAKFVQAGQKVVMMLDEFPGKKLYGQIEFVSREPANQVPRELSVTNGGTIASQPNAQNQEVPMIPAYEASVTIDTDQALMTGFRGHAKIRVGSAPLGKRLIRYLNTVINFR
ncbi:MAG: efflux RND transporter periplasmic adaptor subunit, partial [Planctomycetota bacterium]